MGSVDEEKNMVDNKDDFTAEIDKTEICPNPSCARIIPGLRQICKNYQLELFEIKCERSSFKGRWIKNEEKVKAQKLDIVKYQQIATEKSILYDNAKLEIADLRKQVDELTHKTNEMKVQLDMNQLRNKRMLQAGKELSQAVICGQVGKHTPGFGSEKSDKSLAANAIIPSPIPRDIIGMLYEGDQVDRSDSGVHEAGPPMDSVLVGTTPRTQEGRVEDISDNDAECQKYDRCHNSKSDDVGIELKPYPKIEVERPKITIKHPSVKPTAEVKDEKLKGVAVSPISSVGSCSYKCNCKHGASLSGNPESTKTMKTGSTQALRNQPKVKSEAADKAKKQTQGKPAPYQPSKTNGYTSDFYLKKQTCFNCGIAGHIARNCLYRPYEPSYPKRQMVSSQESVKSKPMMVQKPKAMKTVTHKVKPSDQHWGAAKAERKYFNQNNSFPSYKNFHKQVKKPFSKQPKIEKPKVTPPKVTKTVLKNESKTKKVEIPKVTTPKVTKTNDKSSGTWKPKIKAVPSQLPDLAKGMFLKEISFIDSSGVPRKTMAWVLLAN